MSKQQSYLTHEMNLTFYSIFLITTSDTADILN